MISVEQQFAEKKSIARLRWQCRRGMLELDLLLQPFVEKQFTGLSIAEQDAFKRLLTFPDQELLEYLLGTKTPGNKDVANVTNQIRQAAAN
jgi:antitoxin CptB